MKCSSIQKLFSEYHDGVLSSDLASRFDEHISMCPCCRDHYMTFNASMMMLDEIQEVEMPAGLHNEIMYSLSEEQKRAAKPVKWWKIDWDHAFSVRAPLRAAAFGLALLAIVVAGANLSTINTITAGLTSHQKTTTIYGVDDNKTLQAWGPWGTNFTKLNQKDSNDGVFVNVSAETNQNTRDLYAIRLETKSTEPVDFSIYVLPNNFSFKHCSSGNTSKPVYSGFVGKSRDSVIRLKSDAHGLPLVVKISWDYKDKHHGEFVFLPPKFNKDVSVRETNAFIQDDSVFSAIKAISVKYGVIVLADGHLGKASNSINTSVNTPSEAFYKAIDSSDFKWNTIGQHIYRVESIQ